MKETVIRLEPSLHNQQLEVFQSQARFKIVMAGRRFGKTRLGLWTMIICGLQNPRSLIWYIAPTYRQAKMIAWRQLVSMIPVQARKKVNESELTIELITGSIIELKGADNEDCYDKQTEILTDEGWKYFKDLNRKEKVLTLNPFNLKAQWKKPLRYIEQKYDGKFYTVKNCKLDLMTSPNHRYLIISRKGKIKFKTLARIAHGDSIPMAKSFNGGKSITDDEAAFMGIYLAEGSSYGSCGGDIKKRGGNYEVFIAQIPGIKGWRGNKGNVKRKIEALLKRLGFHYRYRGDGFMILSKKLWSKLIPIGNKYTKFIPDEYKNLNAHKLRILIDWMVMGDGSIRGSSRNYYTVSKRLADDLQEICFKAGFNAVIRIKKQKISYLKDGRVIKPTVPLYEVVIYSNKQTYFTGANGESYISKTFYQGKMYCVEVENNTVLVRRNGKAMWSGNSLRGQGPDLVIFDEVAFIKQHIWEEIIRPSLIDKKGRALFLGTPAGKNWFWKIYNEAELGIDKSYQAFRFTTFDNPYLPKEELEIAKRQTKNSAVFKQEYLAEPQTQEGLVYPEFMKEIHIVAPFEIPKDARLFRSIDWGIHAPCVCLWGAMMPSGEVFIYREHYQSGLPAQKQAEIIKAKTSQEKIEATIIDPSTDKREALSPNMNSVRMEFIRNGIAAVPGDNKVGWGISIVKEYLVNNKLMVFENCENLILEFLTYEWAQAQHENVMKEKPKDGGDDGMDALRYLLVSTCGRSRKHGLDTGNLNGTLVDGRYLVTYENNEIKKIQARKIPPWERQSDSFQFDDYGGFINAGD